MRAPEGEEHDRENINCFREQLRCFEQTVSRKWTLKVPLVRAQREMRELFFFFDTGGKRIFVIWW